MARSRPATTFGKMPVSDCQEPAYYAQDDAMGDVPPAGRLSASLARGAGNNS